MNTIKLTHPFINKCPDIDELFFNKDGEVVCTINAFCGKIKTLSAKYSDRMDENKFKGDALELFTEFMIRTAPEDNRIGIYNYKPITDAEDDDVGVDGFGAGEDGNPATVQVKYRAGNYVLTANADHLSNFLTASWNDFAVPINSKTNMLIVTTGQKVDERTRQKMLKDKVRVLNRDSLRRMYDNRPEWWKRFYESVKNNRFAPSHKRTPIVLRQHQKEAKDAIKNDKNGKGKVLLPTGTGKTIIEVHTAIDSIKALRRKKVIAPIIKVNSSRILLCFQLADDFIKEFAMAKINARYVNFNSGKKDETEYAELMQQEGWGYRKILSTTNPQEVAKVYEDCKKKNMPLVIFSTYHSSERLAESGLVPNMTINDEAHNLVSRNFHRAAKLPTDSNIFFTATEKVTDSDDGLGMNNEDVFDNIIYTKSAKELIDAGEMVPPYLHVVRSSNECRIDTDYEMMFQSIVEAFKHHENKIKEVSYDAENIGAKVLVVCRGQQDLLQMFKTKALEHFKTNYPDIHLFALSSEFGMVNDGEFFEPPVTNIKKYHMLKKLKAMGHNERALIFHVDMIGEGIDVPGVTGIMPFRNCEESKLIQNIGRSTRLHPEDRKRFYNEEISPNDRTIGWIKPYAWVIIPSYMIDSEGIEARFRFIIDRVRREYGYIPQQHTVIDNVEGLSDEDEIDTVNKITKKKKQVKSHIEEFKHEYEKVCVMEKIIMEDKLTQKEKDVWDELKAMGL
ncbi:MAG: DEAD/DEAH box helicase family protein [Synergistaceae bacterium]